MREASTIFNNCGLPKHGFYPPPEGYCKRITCLKQECPVCNHVTYGGFTLCQNCKMKNRGAVKMNEEPLPLANTKRQDDNGKALFKAVNEMRDWLNSPSWEEQLSWLNKTRVMTEKLLTEIDNQIEVKVN